MECGLSLALECDDNKTHKDVDHEEGDNNKVDEIEEEDVRTVILFGTDVCLIWVYGDVQNSAKYIRISIWSQDIVKMDKQRAESQ